MRVNTLRHVLLLVIATLVFIGDRVTKAVVDATIPEQATIPVVPHFFNLVHARNAGAAFGLFSNSPAPWKTFLLIGVSSALLLVVLAMMWRGRQFRWGTGVALALIMGGALSNLFDRIRQGRVLDFLDVYWRDYHWPTFNLADSAIVVGAGLLVLRVLFWE